MARSSRGFLLFWCFSMAFFSQPYPTEAVQCQTDAWAYGSGPEGQNVIQSFQDYVRDSQNDGIRGYCDSCSNTNNFCITLELQGDIEIIGLPPGRGSYSNVGQPWPGQDPWHVGPSYQGYGQYGRYDSARVNRLIYRSCDFGLIAFSRGNWHGWICEQLTQTQAWHKQEPVCRRDDYPWYGYGNGGYDPIIQCASLPKEQKKARSRREATSEKELERLRTYCSRYPNRPHCRKIHPTIPPYNPYPHYHPPTPYPFHTPYPYPYPTIPPYRPYYPHHPPSPQQFPGCSQCYRWDHKRGIKFATPWMVKTGYCQTSLCPGVQMVLHSGSIQINCCSRPKCNGGTMPYPPSPYPQPYPPAPYPYPCSGSRCHHPYPPAPPCSGSRCPPYPRPYPYPTIPPYYPCGGSRPCPPPPPPCSGGGPCPPPCSGGGPCPPPPPPPPCSGGGPCPPYRPPPPCSGGGPCPPYRPPCSGSRCHYPPPYYPAPYPTIPPTPPCSGSRPCHGSQYYSYDHSHYGQCLSNSPFPFGDNGDRWTHMYSLSLPNPNSTTSEPPKHNSRENQRNDDFSREIGNRGPNYPTATLAPERWEAQTVDINSMNYGPKARGFDLFAPSPDRSEPGLDSREDLNAMNYGPRGPDSRQGQERNYMDPNPRNFEGMDPQRNQMDPSRPIGYPDQRALDPRHERNYMDQMDPNLMRRFDPGAQIKLNPDQMGQVDQYDPGPIQEFTPKPRGHIPNRYPSQPRQADQRPNLYMDPNEIGNFNPPAQIDPPDQTGHFDRQDPVPIRELTQKPTGQIPPKYPSQASQTDQRPNRIVDPPPIRQIDTKPPIEPNPPPTLPLDPVTPRPIRVATSRPNGHIPKRYTRPSLLGPNLGGGGQMRVDWLVEQRGKSTTPTPTKPTEPAQKPTEARSLVNKEDKKFKRS